MAGGDGSLAVVATAAAGHGLPFVCVPAGTRNHFALDVGVDRHDLAGALDAFTDGVERRIDVAEGKAACFSTTSHSGSTATRSACRATGTPLVAGTRPALDTGQLGILVLDAPDDGPPPPGRAWSAPHFEVSAAAPVHAGIDGEAVDLAPPLRFTVLPAALCVRISSRHPGVSPSAGRRPRPF
jgi:diacylglycerol kinase family enzyme